MRTGTSFKTYSLSCALSLAWVITSAGCHGPVATSSPRHPADAAEVHASVSRERNDLARGHSWILNRNGVFLYNGERDELVEIALPDWQWVDEPYACLPDLTIGPDGEAVITSNVVAVLWRVDPRTLAVTVHPLSLDADHMKDFGFSTLVYSGEHDAYFAVSDLQGGLWRVDRSLREGKKLAQLEPLRDRCSAAVLRAQE